MVLCAKCNAAEATCEIRSAPCCNGCFAAQCSHKYRSAVTRGLQSKRARPLTVAVALSPHGRASALLHYYTCQETLGYNDSAMALFYYRYFTIGDSADSSSAERLFVPLATALFCEGPNDTQTGSSDEKLSSLLLSVDDPELRDEMRRILLRIAQVRVARLWIGAGVLYVGDTCSRVAVDVISDTCCSRGREIPWRVSALQNFGPFSVGLVRPFVELLNCEVEGALRIHEVGTLQPAQIGPDDSAYTLIEAFVSKLEAEKQATATTVVRTAAKIETEISLHMARPSAFCSLCLAPIARPNFCNGCQRICESLLVEALPRIAQPITW